MTRAADTPTQLLDAAEALFLRRGYARVGVRDIVDAAGANLAAVKYHFGSKRGLYEDVVRRVMRRRDLESAWARLEPAPTTPAAAGVALAEFLHHFIQDVLRPPGDDPCCTLMMHEANEPSEVLDWIVRDFLAPRQAQLVETLRVLRPSEPDDVLSFAAQSVLGQIFHYRNARPFIERLRTTDLEAPACAREVAIHLTRFSLRGVGCPEAFIARTVRRAFPEPSAAPGPAQSPARAAAPPTGTRR
ncbi:MAG: CerR family C-terminal domain-containing protein [Phycisphaerales bacterium]|nr:CerR family C-terminal domain-containing protein [Phycisphaerales bacterium]